MRKKIVLLAFATLALVACGDHNNEPIDESVIPKGEPTDIGCSINIPQSGMKILEMTYADAEAYLTASGWKKDIETDPKGYYFVCADTTQIPGPQVDLIDGPRSAMFLTVQDGKVTDTSIETWCVPEEKPFQQVAKWDAWIHNELKSYEHWSGEIRIPDEYRTYSDFTKGDHQRFYEEIKTFDDTKILGVTVNYVAHYGVGISAQYMTRLVRIKFTAGVYRSF